MDELNWEGKDLDYACTLISFAEQVGIQLWQAMALMKYAKSNYASSSQAKIKELEIGGIRNHTVVANGWIDELRISKGITKYEPPVSCNLQQSGRQPTKKKRNPLFDKYTDIENIQNYNTVFKEGDIVVITEKIHGTNFRAGNLKRYKGNLLGKILGFLFGKYEFVYGSHNVQKTPMNRKMGFYGEDVYGRIAKKYNLKEIIPEDYIVYGEIFGPNIQELTYGMKDIDVRFFDVRYNGKYLNYDEFVEFCDKRNLPRVPEIYKGGFEERWLRLATVANSRLDWKQIREGCVVKAFVEENNPQIGRKVLKSINPEYLAKKSRTDFH